MKIKKKQAHFIFKCLEIWQHNKMIDPATALQINQSIEIKDFDWKYLAKFSFVIAVICLTVATILLMIDVKIIQLLKYYFNSPLYVKAISSTVFSVLFFTAGCKGKQRKPEHIFRNEALYFIGVIFSMFAITLLSEIYDLQYEYYSTVVIICSVIYGILGYYLKSPLTWLLSLLLLTIWCGYPHSLIAEHILPLVNLNYFVYYSFFGMLIIYVGLTFDRVQSLRPLSTNTLLWGLVCCFGALWLLSVFGPYRNYSEWLAVKQIHLLVWSIPLTAGSFIAIYYGLKADNTYIRNFGTTFLMINIITRFIEYLWPCLEGYTVFSILGVSCWILGTHAEKIWNFRFKKSIDLKHSPA